MEILVHSQLRDRDGLIATEGGQKARVRIEDERASHYGIRHDKAVLTGGRRQCKRSPRLLYLLDKGEISR